MANAHCIHRRLSCISGDVILYIDVVSSVLQIFLEEVHASLERPCLTVSVLLMEGFSEILSPSLPAFTFGLLYV